MTIADLYQQGLNEARAGRVEAALDRFDAFLKQRPDNGTAWNDAGTLLYAQHRFEQAIGYFRRAVESTCCPVRAYRNLALAYLAVGRPWQAMQWFESVRCEGLLDASLVQQLADGFEAQGDLASAMETLHRGRQALPDATQLEAEIASFRAKRAKIAFFIDGDGMTFLNDILEFTQGRYEVRVFEGKTKKQLYELMQWSDISWFEWCGSMAQMAADLPKVCRTIVRLHRYEAYDPCFAEMQWENIDTLVTVGNKQVIRAMEHWVRDIRRRVSIVTIPNGVNTQVHTFSPRQPGKNIAFVGALRMIKNPMLLLQCMAALKRIDPTYRLYIAGHMQELLMEQFFEHAVSAMDLQDVVFFEGFQKDIPRWLADKQYLVSTSVIEGCPMGILEAMAAGLKPVIYNFPGAEGIFGREFLFTTPEEFCQRITEPHYDSEAYRSFVERRYPLSAQLLRINELFAMFEKNPWTPSSADTSADSSGLSALTV